MSIQKFMLAGLAGLMLTLAGETTADEPPATPTASQPSASFRIMTWNLEWFYDDDAGDNYSDLAKEQSAPSRNDWNWRRDRVAESIARVQPTIVAVQEVENRRVLWYLGRALQRNHQLEYRELGIEGRDFFTEQDVGMLYRSPADVLSVTQRALPQRMRQNDDYFDVTKHVIAVFEIDHGSRQETVTVLNVHLRSKPEGESLRRRQSRLLHHWIAEAVARGENVIVLGDFNTEETADRTRPDSDIGIASGLHTATEQDDLVDLNLRLPRDDRQTHLLAGRQFDRIMCSRSLLEDDPSGPDLVFDQIRVDRDLAIRGRPDTPDEHWNNYWSLSEVQRDLSDHYPVIATFTVR